MFSRVGPPRVVLVVDSKYNTAELSTLADGTPQMSDLWSRRRLEDAVGIQEAMRILRSGYEAVVARVGPNGSVECDLLDSDAKIVGTFNP